MLESVLRCIVDELGLARKFLGLLFVFAATACSFSPCFCNFINLTVFYYYFCFFRKFSYGINICYLLWVLFFGALLDFWGSLRFFGFDFDFSIEREKSIKRSLEAMLDNEEHHLESKVDFGASKTFPQQAVGREALASICICGGFGKIAPLRS